jgi:hypothetical protein
VGEPVVCENGAHRLEPLADIQRLRREELAATDWRDRCVELGIAELSLAPAGEPAPAVA